ncbi:MAG: glycosyltransferase [Candidatus Limnocylindrales bacterium]
MRPVRVGFLHIGRERSGLRRYGAILAEAAARRPDVEVVESDVGDRGAPMSDLRQACRRLREVDVVHIQWKVADWNPRLGGLPRLEVALRSMGRPTVFTLHDVYAPENRWQRTITPEALGLRRLGIAASSIVVHSQEERRRLAGRVPDAKVEVVPHFVEQRAALPDRAASRASLDVTDRRVITLLGHMIKRRGHKLVIEALSELPEDVIALFVGAPLRGREYMVEQFKAYALELGVADRTRFMGFVPEEELERVLAATDVALAPYRSMSASGALATLISAGRPIVTSDLPQFRELAAMAPGAFHSFAPYRSEQLAPAIETALAAATEEPDPHVEALARRLSTARVVDRYVELYRAAVSRR